MTVVFVRETKTVVAIRHKMVKHFAMGRYVKVLDVSALFYIERTA